MVRQGLANHREVAHAPSTLERIRIVRRGGALEGRHKVFGAAYRLLDPTLPSPTVTRSGFRDFIHPAADRLLTVRELARLQSFPDDYEFKGRRCDTYAKSRYLQQTQHEQVGNAVPPRLGHIVAATLKAQLESSRAAGSMHGARRRLARAFELLDKSYPQDDLGNFSDPLDELVYIVLSRRSREQLYQRTFKALKKKYRSWNQLLDAEPRQIRRLLEPLGLQNQRVSQLRAMLRTIRRDFGRLSLASLKRSGYSEAYNYLRSLPGVNDKTAKCVMLYSLQLPALPVDTHTFRISSRLGLIPKGTSLFRAPALLDAVVPRGQRGRFHVLTVLHGRQVCKQTSPLCAQCPLKTLCPSRARN